jgi:WD40 repeat protein
VSVSPDEKFFAFATLKGVVCILERNQSLKFRRMQMSVEHHGSEVTALQWNVCSSELFVGDDSGKISVISSSAFVVRIWWRLNVT